MKIIELLSFSSTLYDYKSSFLCACYLHNCGFLKFFNLAITAFLWMIGLEKISALPVR